ncbi:MAG: RNA polymerase sigma factor [Clostridia bacterium]|nr:RNA polymerase sigma factor [Clostridia bacterium]
MTLDKQLKKLSNGDESAFEYIYGQTYKTVYYIALSIVKERQLAEDVMQSAYLNVIKNARLYVRGTNAVGWIARIARNEALNLMKKRGRVVYVDERENLHTFGTSSTDDYGLLTDLARRTLEEDEFTVLMLIATQGYKRKEISEILEMPISTVTYKFNRATEKMRKALEDKN